MKLALIQSHSRSFEFTPGDACESSVVCLVLFLRHKTSNNGVSLKCWLGSFKVIENSAI